MQIVFYVDTLLLLAVVFTRYLTEQISCIVHSRAKFISFGRHGNCTECLLLTRLGFGITEISTMFTCKRLRKKTLKVDRYPKFLFCDSSKWQRICKLCLDFSHFIIVSSITMIFILCSIFLNPWSIWWNTL